MKREKGNFEFIKDPEDNKKNYIFQKDKITRNVTYFVSAILVLLILAVVFSNFFFK
ncbi:hypothetical protein MBM09_01500 [Flaviramulus sp. BrNp1-15]|uniref:hypothetical protein n=1 Tax=Flaviramulus sp. BrNp1-15 TaxID=2916754 RepID=UPI001EE92277|nr:hypothetical protein [Flaviramulus sp. BrNp1-15]ULC59664.1 hypothetical protein MBM09_01500 [Flaviramulus sp. BrNp1-15]